MTSPYSGLPYNVEPNLPPAVNISSSTNASPIVITTATAHNLKVGDWFIVIGALEPALVTAIFRAGTVTATDVVVLNVDGTNTTATGPFGAGGTLQPTGFGPTVPILTDGDAPVATLWNTPYQAIFDRLAWLFNFVNFGRRRRRPIVQLADANATIQTSQGDTFNFTPLGTLRTITLRESGPAPYPNERITITTDPGIGGGHILTVQRQGGITIARYWRHATDSLTVWATFEFNNGFWRPVDNSSGSSAGGVTTP